MDDFKLGDHNELLHTAMKMVNKMHPLHKKMTIFEVFPVFKAPTEAVSWENFDNLDRQMRDEELKQAMAELEQQKIQAPAASVLGSLFAKLGKKESSRA